MELNPHQLHYFKRELIHLQLKKELDQVKQTPQVIPTLIGATETSYPFLQFILHRFVLPFPLLQKAEERQFWSKFESFLTEYGKLKLNNYAPRKIREDSQREILLYKLEKLIVVSLTTIIKTQGEEESIKISATPEDIAETLESTHLTPANEVNIITVRDVAEVRRIREHLHSEFIIENSASKIRVARRHGQFRQLRDDLKLHLPTEDIPMAPAKARDPSYNSEATCLHKEKDRILLRSFLHKLNAMPLVAESDVFKKFLNDNPVQLNSQEEKDVEERKIMDRKRSEEEERFKQEVDKQIVELDGLLRNMKQKVMQPNGLLDLFQVIKTTDKIEQLPAELKKTIEWGRINFAFALHTQFVTSDKSVENITNLKRTHSLMPYRAITQILKLSNPFYMVKGVLDLFLAQPFGGKSLFQRIILANMNEETKEMQKDIDELETKIKDPALCKKVSNAVQTELQNNQVVGTKDPVTETLELLKNSSIEPELTADQILRVALANQPGQEEAHQLALDLYQLWVLYARKQEQESLMSLVFQGVTGELMKDLFSIFYEPLAEVYKAANIGETIGHVSHFIEDLISIINTLNVQDATHSAQPFIDLVQRHEQEFYTFVHNVHAQTQTKLFDQLLSYVDSIFALASNGLSARVDMDLCVEKSEITEENYELLKQEIDAVCAYHRERKQRHLDRKRQKLMSTNERDILQDHKEWAGIVSDFADIEEDNLLASHEMNLKPPTLEWIPKVSASFVEQVTHHGVLGLSVIP